MESAGVTWREPLGSTVPTPSMVTSVAFWVCQVRVVDWPFSMLLGLADREAVGAGGGGGGGGGGVSFFLQPLTVINTANDAIAINHFTLFCFTSSSNASKLAKAAIFPPPKFNYRKLQFGIEFLPLVVSWRTCVPSASMLQICSEPERLD